MSDFDATGQGAGGAAGAAEGAAGQTQPGWYPDPGTGQLRWWDGTAWGQFQQAGGMPAAMPNAAVGSADPKSQAAMAHFLGAGLLFVTCYLGFVGPLIIMNGQGKTDPYIRDQAVEAANFQLTILIAMIVSSFLMLILIGFILVPILYLCGLIFGVMGGLAAQRGEWYRYPFSIKFVKA